MKNEIKTNFELESNAKLPVHLFRNKNDFQSTSGAFSEALLFGLTLISICTPNYGTNID